MSKHTPGPWRRQGAIIWGKEIQREVARVKTFPGEPLQDNANARLVAASPELLAACKLLLSCCGYVVDVSGCECAIYETGEVKKCEHSIAFEAIAKAEGG